jgi:hypothetical protein
MGWGMKQLTRATTGFERYNCASAPAIAVASSTRRRSLLEAASPSFRDALRHIMRHHDALWITTPGEIARDCESLPKGTVRGSN